MTEFVGCVRRVFTFDVAGSPEFVTDFVGCVRLAFTFEVAGSPERSEREVDVLQGVLQGVLQVVLHVLQELD